MTDFFYFDFDECIRKVITSLENYFGYYQLARKKGAIYPVGIDGKIRQLVHCYIQTEYYDHSEDDLKILRDNICFVYDIRCEIVYNDLMLKLDDKDNLIFCRRAVKTLLKIYQSSFIKEDNRYDYIFSFYRHFESLLTQVTGLNLDQLGTVSKNALVPKDVKSGIGNMKIEQKINGKQWCALQTLTLS